VTLFAGEGPRAIVDQHSRTAESLVRSFAACLRTVAHPKLLGWPALVVVSPEHARVFREAGWTKQQLRRRLLELLTIPGEELAPGAGGIEEGMPGLTEPTPKFSRDGLLLVHAGGSAGLFSAVIGGWAPGGSQPVTQEVRL
jgi:hypothetical protein